MIYKTAREMLAAWDRGEIVTTLEMGGLGPGYEQAIQILVMELIREYANKGLPGEGSEADCSWGDAVVSRIDNDCCGFSGAQVGAAKQLACAYLSKGPTKFFEWLGREYPERAKDTIMMSRAWPKAPAPPEVAA